MGELYLFCSSRGREFDLRPLGDDLGPVEGNRTAATRRMSHRLEWFISHLRSLRSMKGDEYLAGGTPGTCL